MNAKLKLIIGIAAAVIVIALIGYVGFGNINIGGEEEMALTAGIITGFSDEELPIFIAWIKQEGWYDHTIIGVNHDDQLMTIRDGRGNVFNVTYEFAETHLREHHPLGSYIDELGLEQFITFTLEKKLFQHRIIGITADGQSLEIIGDEGRGEFEAPFELSLPTFFSHITFHHAWTYQDLIDGGYCENSFTGPEVAECRERLSQL